MAAMVIPAGLVGAGEQTETIADTVVDMETTPFETESDDLKIEKVNPVDYGISFDEIQMPEFEKVTPALDPRFKDGSFRNIGSDIVGKDSPVYPDASDFKPLRLIEKSPTRASDTSNNDDLWNGSKIVSNGEKITGELFRPSTDPTGDRGDYIDWYKLELPTVDPRVPGSLKNVTVVLDSWDSDEVTLYELTFSTTEYTVDIFDMLEFFVVYADPFMGTVELGGKKTWYDDGDDSDGWTYDNDHPVEEYDYDNWTFNFRTPHYSRGTEDTNGGTNGITERGWYYIGVYHDIYVTQDAEDRDDYYVDYSFTVSWTDDVNNFPFTESEPDGAPNDYQNATSTLPGMPGKVHSGLNHFDWYRFSGNNPDYLWNQSVNVTVSDSEWAVNQDLGVSANDNWLWVWLIWWDKGRDMTWGTEDDGWNATRKGLYLMITFVDENGDAVDWMIARNQQTGTGTIPLWNINTRLDTPQDPHPALEGIPDRSIFIGVMSEPAKFFPTQTGGLFQSYADYQPMDEYDIDWSVQEVEPNTPPEISEITVISDFEQSESGGYYESEFTINVTYQDENNDPPKNIYLVFDEGTGAQTPEVDLLDLGDPIDPSDKDYTDGKGYQIRYFGSTLKETPSPHTITVWAWDNPSHYMKKSRVSDFAYLNDTLTVWDDDPVSIKDPWDGIPTMSEDEPERLIPLEGFDGAFRDPENRFRGFQIYDKENETWATDYYSQLMHINISKVDGIWQMSINLNHNEWSTEGEPIRLKAYDDHSFATRTTRVYVNPVNDPPKITGIRIGSITYDEESSQGRLDNTDPLRPVIHLEDVQAAELVEDELFEFEILAEDTDREEDKVDLLEFDFENGLSDPWKEFPDVGYNTGIVTLENGVTNDDVKKKNSKMTFSISDRGTDGTIILTMYFEVVNVNDDPSISIPSTTPRQYTQYQSGGIRIKPLASDIDPDDILSFSVNFDDSIEHDGDDVEAIADQLPNMDSTKDIDWGIDTNTGEFWFKPDDQNIWNTSSGWVKSVEIVLVFQVTDKAGATATDQITLVLNDLNEEPEAPDEIRADPDASQDIYVGDEIEFSVDEVTDPDGDRITYKWDFGDGATSEGRVVTHTYSKKGWRTVQMWVEDGQFQTEKISYRFEVLEQEGDDDDDTDDDTTGPDVGGDSGGDDNTMLFLIAGLALVIIIVVIVVLFFVLRKKEAPPAQQYPMYDQAQLGAYGAQGLPPGAAPELPPGQDPYAPQEHLPPATQEAQAQPEAPEAQPEMQQEQPESPAGNVCPSCGSGVDPSWFLCPNCKSPLQ
jgi:chitodextrinase